MCRSRLLLSQIGQDALPLEVQHWTYFKTLWVSQTVNVALRNIFEHSVRNMARSLLKVEQDSHIASDGTAVVRVRHAASRVVLHSP